jgi:hypothetical protein
MARRKGIKEKVHLPIYDSVRVAPKKQLRDVETGSVFTFFVHTKGKSKLETNASLFSDFTRFEAGGMRVVISDLPAEFPDEITAARKNAAGVIGSSTSEIDEYLAGLEENIRPLHEQYFASNGTGSLIAKLIYNTVTALIVGEKTMIQMPTWFFLGDPGPSLYTPREIHRVEPSATPTFRFAEPIVIDKQQNFRAEIEVPHAESLKELQRIYGPMLIWVVLDGDLTREA